MDTTGNRIKQILELKICFCDYCLHCDRNPSPFRDSKSSGLFQHNVVLWNWSSSNEFELFYADSKELTIMYRKSDRHRLFYSFQHEIAFATVFFFSSLSVSRFCHSPFHALPFPYLFNCVSNDRQHRIGRMW